jgi:hypothetical protein
MEEARELEREWARGREAARPPHEREAYDERARWDSSAHPRGPLLVYDEQPSATVTLCAGRRRRRRWPACARVR